jgi:hypothetical protein
MFFCNRTYLTFIQIPKTFFACSRNYHGMPILFYSSQRSTDIEKVISLDSFHQIDINLSCVEYSQAVDFVDRALFTYERSFIGAFNFTSGLNRLDFDRVENRPFFLAIHRQVT